MGSDRDGDEWVPRSIIEGLGFLIVGLWVTAVADKDWGDALARGGDAVAAVATVASSLAVAFALKQLKLQRDTIAEQRASQEKELQRQDKAIAEQRASQEKELQQQRDMMEEQRESQATAVQNELRRRRVSYLRDCYGALMESCIDVLGLLFDRSSPLLAADRLLAIDAKVYAMKVRDDLPGKDARFDYCKNMLETLQKAEGGAESYQTVVKAIQDASTNLEESLTHDEQIR